MTKLEEICDFNLKILWSLSLNEKYLRIWNNNINLKLKKIYQVKKMQQVIR